MSIHEASPIHRSGHRNRRAFLVSAAAAAGGMLIASTTAADTPKESQDDAAFAGIHVEPTPPRTSNYRKNIAFLPDTELDQLREAFRVLRANNDQIYRAWVQVHAIHCQHNNYLIWPWHRAFLYYFELRLQNALPGASPPVTIPYWGYNRVGNGTGSDTTEFRKLPAPYRPQSVNGQRNPLWVQRRGNVNSGSYALPFLAVRTDRITAGNRQYVDFCGNLENEPHNNVHNMLGQPMQDPLYSPRDPVFWLHHSLLDFAWEQWRSVAGHEDLVNSPGLAGWRRTPLSGFTGSQFPRRLVEDFLYIEDLGYTYVDQIIEVLVKAGKPPILSSKEIEFESAKLSPAPTSSLRPVRIRFEQLEYPKAAILEARVFLGVPNAKPDTPLDDPGFVGVFTLYAPRHGHGRADRTVTLDLDTTDVLSRLIASKQTTKFAITVVTVAFDNKGQRIADVEPLRYKAISVQIGN